MTRSLTSSSSSVTSSSLTEHSFLSNSYFFDILIVFILLIFIPLLNTINKHKLTIETISILIFISLFILWTRFTLSHDSTDLSNNSKDSKDSKNSKNSKDSNNSKDLKDSNNSKNQKDQKKKKNSLFSILFKSLFISGFFYIFGPVCLEYTPTFFLRPFVKFPYEHNLSPDLGTKEYLKIKTYENITLKQAYEIVATTNVPIVFRGIIPDSEVIGRNVISRLESTNKTFLSQTFQARPYDFFRGSRFEASLEATVTDVLKSKNNEYIGFEPLLTKEETKTIMGDDIISTIMVDHSFLANFNETIVTTFVHAAPAAMAWSVQLIGKKTWYLWDPSLYGKLNMGWFCRVSVPSYGDEALLFTHPAYRVTIGPGDILVFPPLWYHTVVTHSNLNLMINFRTTFGNWSPSLIPAIRFFSANVLLKWVGQSTPHHQPGVRKIRMENLQEVFDVSPESLRWDNPDVYIENH